MRVRWFLGLASLALLPLAAPLAAEPIPVTGRVVDTDGEAIARAAVELHPLRTSIEEARLALGEEAAPEPVAKARTDGRGAFRIAAPGEGMWRLVARAPGYVSHEQWLTPLVDHTELGPLSLVRDEGLEVRVVDAAGRPVAGAYVRAYAGRGQQVGRTDEQGRLTLSRGTDHALHVAATAPGLLHVEEPGFRRSELTLRLGAGRRQPIEVRSPQGKPLQGVLLGVGQLLPLPLALTDEAGRAEVTLPAGEALRLTLVGKGGRYLEREVTAGKPDEDGEIPLVVLTLPEPARMSGQVVDAETKAPLAGAWVWDPLAVALFVRTDRRGIYDLPLLDQGPQQLFRGVAAAAGGYLEQTDRIPDTARRSGRGPTLELPPAATLRGTVVAAGDRQPVVGAALTAVPAGAVSPSARYSVGPRRATSTADGGFTLSGLSPAHRYEIQIVKEGFAPRTLELLPLDAERVRVGFEIVLEEGHRAFGVVLAESQEPVPGAEVTLRPTAPRRFPPRRLLPFGSGSGELRATTGPEGRFEIPNLPGGSFDLAVRASDFAPALVPGLAVPEGAGAMDLGTVYLTPGAVIEGRVVDRDGRPLEGAEIEIVPGSPRFHLDPFSRRGSSTPPTVSAADGTFTIRDLAPGDRVNLRARKEGYAQGDAPGVEAPPAEPVEIALVEVGGVSGQVVDERGAPVAEAQVTVSYPSDRSGNAWGGTGDSTGDDGRFLVEDVPPGTVRVEAHAEGYAPGEVGTLEVEAGKELTGVRLVLATGAAVFGRVVGPDGAPVPEANVYRSEMRPSASHRAGYTTTDDEGEYRLEGLEPGHHTVAVQHPGLPTVKRDVEVAGADVRLDFRLEAGVEIRGRVTDPAGAPLAGAQVVAFGAGNGARAASAEDGSFTLTGLAPGAYRVQAAREGYASRGLEEPLTVGESGVSGIEIRLERGGVIAGRILGLTLDELGAVEVRASAAGPAFDAVTARPDFEGEFRLPAVAAGRWSVTAFFRERRESEEVTLEPGQEEVYVELDFSGGLTLTGQVLEDDQPLAGVRLALSGPAGNVASTTDYAGRFRFGGLARGSYRVTVLRHTEEIDLDTDREISIEIATARISGRVVDETTGLPVPQARLALDRGEGAGELSLFNHQPWTDSTGAFRLDQVPEGDYRLIVSREGYARSEVPVTLAGLDIEGLEVRLAPTEGAVLIVSGPAGAPPHLFFVGFDAAGRAAYAGDASVDQGGRARLSTLPAGDWEILVGSPGYATVPVAVTAPGPPVPVSLVPGARLEIEIPELRSSGIGAALRMIGTDGRPYRDITRGGNVMTEWPVREGRSTVQDLPPGVWTVTVETADGRTLTAPAAAESGKVSRVVVE